MTEPFGNTIDAWPLAEGEVRHEKWGGRGSVGSAVVGCRIGSGPELILASHSGGGVVSEGVSEVMGAGSEWLFCETEPNSGLSSCSEGVTRR